MEAERNIKMNGVSKRVCISMLTINTLAQIAKDEATTWCICGIVLVCLTHYAVQAMKDRKSN